MATVPSSLSKFHVSTGPDYEHLWKRLEAKLFEIRQNTADAICIEDDPNKSKILRGTWGAYGLVINEMRQFVADARGDKPTES